MRHMNSIRGGVWYNKPHFVRASHQDYEYTTFRLPNGGFRCVRGGPYREGLRGGAWYVEPRSARASFRSNYDPANRIFSVGFRCCVRRGYDS